MKTIKNTMKFKTIPLVVGIISITLQAALAQSSLWTNLVSYWPFDTATATSTPDLAIGNDLFFGTSAPGTNAPTLVVGERTNCFQFNGTNQFLGLLANNADTGLPIYYSTNG